MSQDKNDISKDFLLLGGFLDFLLANGFEFGPDKYILVKQLLNALEPGLSREQFKRTLCPLFAYNVEKQALFNYLYDRYFESFAVQEKQEKPAADTKENIHLPKQPGKKKFILYGTGAFALLVAILAALYYSMVRERLRLPIWHNMLKIRVL